MTPQTSPPRGAAELSALAEIGDDAKALLSDDDLPRDFIEQLVAKGLFPDAVRVIAHALPRREAVWWAWVCARKVAGAEPPPPIKAALDDRALDRPADGRESPRGAALRRSREFERLAGCAALARFLSSGSLAPPDVPPVPPGVLTAKAVSGSVTLAAVH
jgi:hypothetical protein